MGSQPSPHQIWDQGSAVKAPSVGSGAEHRSPSFFVHYIDGRWLFLYKVSLHNCFYCAIFPQHFGGWTRTPPLPLNITRIMITINYELACWRQELTWFYVIYTVSGKWVQNVFVIYPPRTILMKFGNRFLNKFAAKSSKQFPPHLDNVSTLLCETETAHRGRATIELLQKEAPEFIPPHMWPPNLPDLNPVDYSACGCCKRRCTKYISVIWKKIETATETGVGQAGSCHHYSSHSSVASSIPLDQLCLFCTPSLAIFPVHHYQLDSNLTNLEAKVEMG